METEREVPVEFAAFCALYRQRYLEYAHSRLSDARRADSAVRQALAELAEQWDQALRSPHTNAYAWRVLTQHIRAHAHPPTPQERNGQDGNGDGDGEERVRHEKARQEKDRHEKDRREEEQQEEAGSRPAEHCESSPPPHHGGRSFLPDHTDDARILHQDLGMPLLEATEMMGHTAPRPR
ncbi:hypothetical protein [Streptomyces spirodelae]|uniref:Sigma-70 family RNA polymerase sigma factor n=1 Tax=Streptomyces spirodelae TaxID=2812904 RepID=A0ABS3WX56_9ACTN|nr:hypothetical protein [Streptomyces spirodelae]MBO8187659.1 hypothetical protein [Streptomyces spirodelae]